MRYNILLILRFYFGIVYKWGRKWLLNCLLVYIIKLKDILYKLIFCGIFFIKYKFGEFLIIINYRI